MSKRKSLWKLFVYAIVILPILYWASAAPTLWVWTEYENSTRPTKSTVMTTSGFNGNILIFLPPKWWSTVYSPVLWAADHPILGPVAMKPFEWLNVSGEVKLRLLLSEWERDSTSR